MQQKTFNLKDVVSGKEYPLPGDLIVGKPYKDMRIGQRSFICEVGCITHEIKNKEVIYKVKFNNHSKGRQAIETAKREREEAL